MVYVKSVCDAAAVYAARSKVAKIEKKAKPPTKNLTEEEEDREEIRKNKDIII